MTASAEQVAAYEYDGLHRRVSKAITNGGDGVVHGSDEGGNRRPRALLLRRLADRRALVSLPLAGEMHNPNLIDLSFQPNSLSWEDSSVPAEIGSHAEKAVG